jgi:protein-L-isoaspartate(D-aspartate) O-methyltransferase
VATLLRGASVAPYLGELATHQSLPVERQQRLLREALVAGGAAPEVAAAVAGVPRHNLVRDELRSRAYLDEFHEAKSGSGLTPPSLVAAMLERLKIVPGVRVLELGIGSGFHALAALRLGAAEVVGVEADGEVLEAARSRLHDLPGASALTLLHGVTASAAADRGPFDRVYATFAYTRAAAALLPFVVDGGLVQVPRPVLPMEFAREALLQPERDKYGSFERFFEEWQQNLCLTTYRRERERLRVVDKMYAVRFVGQRDEPLPAPGRATPA